MSSTIGLGDAKWIDRETKDLVFGYIKQIQSLFRAHNVYYTIPSLVSHWCFLYYFYREYFDINACDKSYILTVNHIATKIKTGNAAISLFRVVTSGVHKWRFQLLHVNELQFPVMIGIWKTNYIFETDKPLNWFTSKHKGYAYDVADATLNRSIEVDSREYGEKCTTGDIVEMILDLDKLELRYIIHNKDCGVAFKNIEKTAYKAAVSIYEQQDGVELLFYEQLNVNVLSIPIDN